jgi:hypothetical protein
MNGMQNQEVFLFIVTSTKLVMSVLLILLLAKFCLQHTLNLIELSYLRTPNNLARIHLAGSLTQTLFLYPLYRKHTETASRGYPQ